MDEESQALVEEWIAFCDVILAEQDVPLHERPLRAAVLFVHHAVEQVGNQQTEEVPKDIEFSKLLKRCWFGPIVRMSEAWYEKTFGPAAIVAPSNSISGAVLYRGAIQLLRIPTSTHQKAEKGYQLWVALPDHVPRLRRPT
jgi:hypothetical protein